MMKLVFAAGLFSSMVTLSSAQANQIVQQLAMEQAGADQSPYSITGNPFNPSLGTLESVTMTFSGNFFADIFVPDTSGLPLTDPTYVDGSVFAGTGNGIMGADFGPITLMLLGNDYVGLAPVSLTNPYSFPFVEAFLGGGSAEELLGFDFFSPLGFPAGATSDSSSFEGTLTLTYNFEPLPEPASLAGFLVGLTAVGYARRRRAA